MIVIRLFRSWTPAEKWSITVSVLSVVGFILSALTSVMEDDRTAALIAFGGVAILAIVLLLILISRGSFQIVGYKSVMRYLEYLAKTSQRSIWTVRTHGGVGERERRFFEIVNSRVSATEDPIEDFRRVIRLHSQANPHIAWLIDEFGKTKTARVWGFKGPGPRFDFLIVDGKIAVIGFPMVGGEDNMGAIVLRRRASVRGVESVFLALVDEGQLLFQGSRDNNLTKLKAEVNEIAGGVERG